MLVLVRIFCRATQSSTRKILLKPSYLNKSSLLIPITNKLQKSAFNGPDADVTPNASKLLELV